jgi:hypothetical protein
MLTILIKAEAASKERHLDLSMPAIMVEEHLRQFFRMIEESENVPGSSEESKFFANNTF